MPSVAINSFTKLGIHVVEQQQAGAHGRAFVRWFERYPAPDDRFNDGFLSQGVA
jgi:hypothetical protein